MAENVLQDQLMAIECYCTYVNGEKFGGILRLLEKGRTDLYSG